MRTPLYLTRVPRYPAAMNEFEDFPDRVPLSRQALSARPTSYLDDLNAPQREAVEALEGPVLMLAGAGTGKTKALTTRIAHLLNTGTARPNEVLAVTFTNKAAREMKSRVASLLGQTVEGMPWLGTFHSIGVKLLRRHAELVGLKTNFTILDTDDQLRLLKQVLAEFDVDQKRHPPRVLASMIDGWKNNCWSPQKVPRNRDSELWAERIYSAEEAESTESAYKFRHRNPESGAYGRHVVLASKVYARYQSRLLTLNACDFGDLLLHVVTILQENEDVLERYQRWFRYILVDEYQDTNVAQYLWLRLLAQKHRNICCVGDDDQSIYGWRGAEVGNILRFEKDFPGAKVVRLEQNYRSTPHILAAASSVIAANTGRLGKTLFTEETEGKKVHLISHWDGEEEARWIGEEIESLQSGTRGMEPRSLNDIAILVRASHQMRAFEDRFLSIGLPYRVIGGPRFYERMEIRDAMAYFRLAISRDDDLAFERIYNKPKRGLGDKAFQKIQMAARENGVSLYEGSRLVLDVGDLGGKGGKELQKLLDGLDRWHKLVLDERDHIELAQIIIDESEYPEMYLLPPEADRPRKARDAEAAGRLENLKELIEALEGFDNLQGFLEHVSLVMDNASDDEDEKVSIMTLHAAKGLEFPAVFLPGWEDGLFPSQRAMDENGLKGLEEERRLAYVGLTRAEEYAVVSFAQNRQVFGSWQSQMASRFIDEMDPGAVEVLGGAAQHATVEVESDMYDRAAKTDGYNSPGWKRLKSRQNHRGLGQPREAKGMVIDASAVSAFTTGERVFHEKFGYGTILEIEGDKLDISFEKAGFKKVVAKFVKAAEAADDVPF